MNQTSANATAREAKVFARLETAAVTSAEAFSIWLAHSLHLSRELALAITQDQGGEALVIALRAMGADADAIVHLCEILRDDLSKGQSAWRRALALSVSQELAQIILQAMTCVNVQAPTNAQLTTYAEQKLQLNLSA